jgi:hypothetical protein
MPEEAAHQQDKYRNVVHPEEFQKADLALEHPSNFVFRA